MTTICRTVQCYFSSNLSRFQKLCEFYKMHFCHDKDFSLYYNQCWGSCFQKIYDIHDDIFTYSNNISTLIFPINIIFFLQTPLGHLIWWLLILPNRVCADK